MRPTALITGGSRGIGAAIARALRGAGFSLHLVARDRDRLAAAAEKHRAERFLAVDLARAESWSEIATWFGERPPDVLVNNAGTAPTARFEATDDELLARVLAVHVAAPFALARGFLPGMRERGSGRLIQIASTAGLRSYPYTAAYTIAKHGMVGMTRALICELGAAGGVRAHAVCPGFVDTDITRSAADAVAARGQMSREEVLARFAAMNRLGRLITAEEVAVFVARLATGDDRSSIWDLDRDPPAAVE